MKWKNALVWKLMYKLKSEKRSETKQKMNSVTWNSMQWKVFPWSDSDVEHVITLVFTVL